jgi:hypothetical protein
MAPKKTFESFQMRRKEEQIEATVSNLTRDELSAFRACVVPKFDAEVRD